MLNFRLNLILVVTNFGEFSGPIAIINKRPMCPGIEGLEGSNHGHDVISVPLALKYLEAKGHSAAVEYLNSIKKPSNDYKFLGSGDKWGSNRNVFGEAVVSLLGKFSIGKIVFRLKLFLGALFTKVICTFLKSV